MGDEDMRPWRKKFKKWVRVIGICWYAGQTLASGTDSSIMSSAIQKKPVTVMRSVPHLYYFTFSSGNPIAIQQTQPACPLGMIFVNASKVSVQGFLNLSSATGGAVVMWQCLANVLVWQGENKQIPDLDSLDPNHVLSHIEQAFSQTQTNWQSANAFLGNTQYTAFQFPNNAYVPAGIGGSGIGCLDAGGHSSVTCQLGGLDLLVQKDSNDPNSSLYYVYLPPGAQAACNVYREYGKSGIPTCDYYGITVPAGQGWMGACCNKVWKGKLTSLGDKNFNTCMECPP